MSTTRTPTTAAPPATPSRARRDPPITRRRFVAGSAAALLLSGMPRGWVGGAWADEGPEAPDVRLGIIALTDCAPIVMAHELGLFAKHGIRSTVSKEASWAAIRDRLTLGENQATHMLYGMPYASTLGLMGAPKRPVVIALSLNRNGQAITLATAMRDRGVRTPSDLKPLADEARAAGTPLAFAMTFPPGTHAMWIRYWLASGGIHPDRDVSLVTIPPPQMVANMKVGKMVGFCVGEPWNARAVADGIGYTAVTTQQLWRDHPEKVLAFTAEFVERNPRTARAVVRAVLEAARWADEPGNRGKLAEVLARPQYINTSVDVIRPRLDGRYDYGDGRVEDDPYGMTFFARDASLPLKSHGLWWLTQLERWGMVQGPLDYRATVDRVHRPDLYRAAAGDLGIVAPTGDLRAETLFDGVTFDPAEPERYARGFAVHSLPA